MAVSPLTPSAFLPLPLRLHLRLHLRIQVETIGDCYMAVTGLPDTDPRHADKMALFALDMAG